jgi:hypothetical protein
MRERLVLAGVLAAGLAAVTAWFVGMDYLKKRDKEAAEAAVRKKQADEAAWQQRVLVDARALVPECERLKDIGTIRLRGKAIVWDLTESGGRMLGDDVLSADLRASSADPEVTVLLISENLPVRRKTYEVAQLSPYRGGAADLVREAISKGVGTASPSKGYPSDWRKLWNGSKEKEPAPSDPPGIPGYRVDRKVCVVSWPEKKAVGCTVVTGEEPPSSVYLNKGDKEYRNNSLAPLGKWLTSLPR